MNAEMSEMLLRCARCSNLSLSLVVFSQLVRDKGQVAVCFTMVRKQQQRTSGSLARLMRGLLYDTAAVTLCFH